MMQSEAVETSELYREVKSRPSEDGSLPFQKDSAGFNTEARRRCLHLLEYSPRTIYQLKKRLMDDGFSAEEADDAIRYAESFGYVDDGNYAMEYVRTGCQKRAGVSFICSFQAAVWIRNRLKMHLRPMQMSRKIRCAVWHESVLCKSRLAQKKIFKGSKKSCIKGFPYEMAKRAVWELRDEYGSTNK